MTTTQPLTLDNNSNMKRTQKTKKPCWNIQIQNRNHQYGDADDNERDVFGCSSSSMHVPSPPSPSSSTTTMPPAATIPHTRRRHRRLETLISSSTPTSSSSSSFDTSILSSPSFTNHGLRASRKRRRLSCNNAHHRKLVPSLFFIGSCSFMAILTAALTCNQRSIVAVYGYGVIHNHNRRALSSLTVFQKTSPRGGRRIFSSSSMMLPISRSTSSQYITTIMFAKNDRKDNDVDKQSSNSGNDNKNSPKMSASSTRSSKNRNNSPKSNRSKSQNKSKAKAKKKKQLSPEEKKKQEILKQVQAKLKMKQEEQIQQRQSMTQKIPDTVNDNKEKTKDQNSSTTTPQPPSSSFTSLVVNPFQAGRELRKTIDSLARGLSPIDSKTKQKYYLDDRFLETDAAAPAAAASSRTMFGSDSVLLKGEDRDWDGIGSSSSSLSSSSLFLGTDDDMFVPEVLVVGATGSVGRLIVRRLLLEGRAKVRVLVRDLYSDTLNMLGTGVTYCQGDLSNVESLEYALTDVDKIVYVAGAPRPDEKGWQGKMERIAAEYRGSSDSSDPTTANEIGSDLVFRTEDMNNNKTITDQWEEWASTLETRARLAEQVDFIGMGNLVRAYQNVRHADFGTSQAAKRSLFKFSGRAEDFYLFSLDEGDIEPAIRDSSIQESMRAHSSIEPPAYFEQDDVDDQEDIVDSDDDYDNDDYEEMLDLEYDTTGTGPAKAQVRWMRNSFGNGAFVGRVPRAVVPRTLEDGTVSSNVSGGEAAIVSSRLRSRDDPESGIDLKTGGFAGFLIRLVGDGGTYELFVRTKSFAEEGIEYICQFTTDIKPPSSTNKSRSRFKTVRLGFERFRPVIKKASSLERPREDQGLDDYEDVPTAPPFVGSDVRHIGFRFKASSNVSPNLDFGKLKPKDREYQGFYIAIDYIKVFRNQPEPEFIYLSDARIPPTVSSGMVDHKQRRLMLRADENGDASSKLLLDDKTLKSAPTLTRSPEETYYKYRGEEILKSSGLSYTIIRVAGFNELPTSEASTIDLLSGRRIEELMKNEHMNSHDGHRSDGDDLTAGLVTAVSRSEVAQVCVAALMDPSALNKSMYMSKKKSGRGIQAEDEDISMKFESIPTDGQ